MFRAALTFFRAAESASSVDSISERRADSLADEVERYRSHERTATMQAPIDNRRAVLDTNNSVNVVELIATLQHGDNSVDN
jgi:hypothetical protein